MGPKNRNTSDKGKTKNATKLPKVAAVTSPAKQPETEEANTGEKENHTELPVVEGALPKIDDGSSKIEEAQAKVPEELIEELCSTIAFIVANECCYDILNTSKDIEGNGLLQQALEQEKEEKNHLKLY